MKELKIVMTDGCYHTVKCDTEREVSLVHVIESQNVAIIKLANALWGEENNGEKIPQGKVDSYIEKFGILQS